MRKCLFEQDTGDRKTIAELMARLAVDEPSIIHLHSIPEIIGSMEDVFYLIQAYLASTYLDFPFLNIFQE